MDLAEVYRRLSIGPLSNLAIGKDGIGDIQTAKKPAVVLYLNEVLQKLHSRFVLKQEQVILQVLPHRTLYPLLVEHTRSQSGSAEAEETFLLDTPDEPFIGDVIKVLEAVDNYQNHYDLNETHSYGSIYATNGDTLQIPEPVIDQKFAILYQANHAVIDYEGETTQEVDIPDVLNAALISYIAGKLYLDIGSDDSLRRGAAYINDYEAACFEAEQKDLLSQTHTHLICKFQDRGFI